MSCFSSCSEWFLVSAILVLIHRLLRRLRNEYHEWPYRFSLLLPILKSERMEYSEQCTEAAFAGKATAGWWCWSLVWSFNPPCGNWRLQAYVGKWTDLFLAQAMGPFISWDFSQAFRFLCFAASRQVCKGSLGRNAVLLEFGLWKHMFAFAKR